MDKSQPGSFETSRSENPQYFVDVVKDKRTKNNNIEFLIGWRDTDPSFSISFSFSFSFFNLMVRQYLTVTCHFCVS